MTGRIIRALSGFYDVETESGETVFCRARGKFRFGGETPLVGDFAEFEGQTVTRILPRKNAFIRPAVANVDQLVVFASDVIPVTDPVLIDRICVIAASRDVPVVLVINKCDLSGEGTLAQIYRDTGIVTIQTSAETGEGIDALRAQLSGKFSVFTGNSGVGKSSVLNRLNAELHLPVGEVSEKLGRGRHTTRHIEIYRLPDGARVADTPGFSSFDTERMELVPAEELAELFPEFAPYIGKCRFPDCAHLKEPGCAVRAALEEKTLQQSRYDSYVKLYETAKSAKQWE